jgi:hypothetical protein
MRPSRSPESPFASDARSADAVGEPPYRSWLNCLASEADPRRSALQRDRRHGPGGDPWGRLSGQLQFEFLQQEAELGFGLGVAGEQSSEEGAKGISYVHLALGGAEQAHRLLRDIARDGRGGSVARRWRAISVSAFRRDTCCGACAHTAGESDREGDPAQNRHQPAVSQKGMSQTLEGLVARRAAP